MITNRAGDGCPAEIPGLEIPEDSLTISRHVSTDVTPVRVSSWQMVNNTGQNSWRGLAPTSSVNDRDAHREDVWQILSGMGLVPKSHIVLGRELLESPSKTSFERLVLAGFHPLQDKHLLRIRKLIPQVASVDMRLDHFYEKRRNELVSPTVENSSRNADLVKYWQRDQAHLVHLLPRFGFNWTAALEMATIATHIRGKMDDLSSKITGVEGHAQEVSRSREELLVLEAMVRMPVADYRLACSRLEEALVRQRQPNSPVPMRIQF